MSLLSMEEGSAKKTKSSDVGAIGKLTDDLLVEILSRLPAKSLSRLQCVSKSWRDIISDPYNRKKLPQTLAGFFHRTYDVSAGGFAATGTRRWQFTNVSGRGPPLVGPDLAFIPNNNDNAGDIVLLDSCNGLLLCRNGGWIRFGIHHALLLPPQRFNYIVCNPATKSWITLPDSGHTGAFRTAHLAVDPAVSSHFHVLEYEFLDDDEDEDDGQQIHGVDENGGEHIPIATVVEFYFYSSRTAEWSRSVREFSQETYLEPYVDSQWRSVFHNGALNFICSLDVIGAMDIDTQKWRYILLPPGDDSVFLGQSQGCLFYISKHVDKDNNDQLSFWALEDYASGVWSLKLTVSTMQLYRASDFKWGTYPVIAVHPECNIIYLNFPNDQNLMSYNMDRSEAHSICDLGRGYHDLFMPYVPLFSSH